MQWTESDNCKVVIDMSSNEDIEMAEITSIDENDVWRE